MAGLINPKLSEKLAKYREARAKEARDINLPNLFSMAEELIDIMETELICEGLLNADA